MSTPRLRDKICAYRKLEVEKDPNGFFSRLKENKKLPPLDKLIKVEVYYSNHNPVEDVVYLSTDGNQYHLIAVYELIIGLKKLENIS